MLFKQTENIPKNFIIKIEELFKIWRDKWEIFNNKYFQGLFMYTYDNNSYNKIKEYYSKFLETEIDKYSEDIIKLYNKDSQKIKTLGYESGLDTDCDFGEIIMNLKRIKKMELVIDLSKDLDGNECVDIPQASDQGTSKIQRILKSMDENFKNNKENNSNKENMKVHSKDSDIDDQSKTIKNNEENIPSKTNEDYYNDDIDGEPL